MALGRLSYSVYDDSTIKRADGSPSSVFCYSRSLYTTECVFAADREGQSTHWSALPNVELDNKLRGRARTLPGVKVCAFHPDGRYFVMFTDGKAQWSGALPDHFNKTALKCTPSCVSFGAGADSYFIQSDLGAAWCGIPPAAERAIRNTKSSVQVLALHPSDPDDYVVVFEDGSFHMVFDCDDLYNALCKMKPREYVKSLQIGEDETYLLHICRLPDPPPAAVPAPTPPPAVPPPPASSAASQSVSPTPASASQQTPQPLVPSTRSSFKVVEVKNRVYFGPVDDKGGRHGRGICSYFDKHPSDWKWYVGGFVNDRVTGSRGLCESKNGNIYHGELVNGDFDGFGTLLTSDDECYVGRFKKSKPHGFGLKAFSDGRFTIGNFANGMRNGACETFYPPDRDDDWVHLSCRYVDNHVDTFQAQLRLTGDRIFTGNCKEMKGSTGYGKTLDVADPTTEERRFVEHWLKTGRKIIEEGWAQAHGRGEIRQVVDLGKPSPALRKFLRGRRLLTRLGVNSVEEVSFASFGYHGTSSKEAVRSICQEGFDPSLRQLQNQGPGEYFALRYQDALTFAAAKTTSLIFVASLSGPQLLTVDEFCSVCVNPPKPSGHSFCLPLFEVHFDRSKLTALHDASAGGKRWQWLWTGDHEDQLVPYHEEQNDALCALHTRHLRRDPSAPKTVTVNMHRLNSSAVDEYIINFGDRTQINKRTQYKRNVVWRRVPGIPLPFTVTK